MEVRERNAYSTSADGLDATASEQIEYGKIDFPDYPNSVRDTRTLVEQGGDNTTFFLGSPRCQCFQGMFLGMFLFLVLTGASLSILIMGYKDVVKQLREELDMLNSSMQIMELQGKESTKDGKEKEETCDLNWLKDLNLETDSKTKTDGLNVKIDKSDSTKILVDFTGIYKLKFWAVRNSNRSSNLTCGTTLLSKDASNKWVHLKKFDCPENAKRGDIVTWQTLTCLRKDYPLSIRMDQSTSAFRCVEGGQKLSIILTLMGKDEDC